MKVRETEYDRRTKMKVRETEYDRRTKMKAQETEYDRCSNPLQGLCDEA